MAGNALLQKLLGASNASRALTLILVSAIILLSQAPHAAGDVARGASNSGEQERLTYVTLSGTEFRRSGLSAKPLSPPLRRPYRKIPAITLLAKLDDDDLVAQCVPLPEADTLSGHHFFEGQFGLIQKGSLSRLINPGILLVKFRNVPHVAALRVESLRELDALRAVQNRSDVEFAELDAFEQRQFQPNDALLTNQWHHTILGSFQAWNYSLGEPSVRVAIVDTPFQMNHPDLAAHTDSGWDVVNSVPVTSSAGIEHSTLCAGLAAAVINNELGVAGAGNCRIVPININGAISEMYDAVIWSADHGVRVVNISWTGADSDSLNIAGGYLKTKSRGLLVMPGGNGTGFLNYTNQPHIYCVAMTDAADNARSRFGTHIDFSAPGWQVFSTTTNSGYGFGSGTSYSAPIFSGVMAVLFSINPTLGPEAAIELMKQNAADLGSPGWDSYYGWGRINFSAAAAAAAASRPVIASFHLNNGAATVTVNHQPDLSYALYKAPNLESGIWMKVTNAIVFTNGTILSLTDPVPAAYRSFYRIEVNVP